MTKKEKKRKAVIGIDEAGRGPLAGPVVAVAVTIKKEKENDFAFLKIEKGNKTSFRDSKKYSPLRREKIYENLRENPCVFWGLGVASEKEIDKMNILQATKLAMERALKKTSKKIRESGGVVIVDGNIPIETTLRQRCVVRGDESFIECALASIIAKTERDRLMIEYHKKYPRFGFDKHKGYGTKEHRKALLRYGPSPIHRRSFKIPGC